MHVLVYFHLSLVRYCVQLINRMIGNRNVVCYMTVRNITIEDFDVNETRHRVISSFSFQFVVQFILSAKINPHTIAVA